MARIKLTKSAVDAARSQAQALELRGAVTLILEAFSVGNRGFKCAQFKSEKAASA